MSTDLGMKDEFGMAYPVESPSKGETKVCYPEFHYSGDKELDLPEEGEMEVRFKVTRRASSERNGKKRYECTVEIREILEVEDEDETEAPASSGSEGADALDQILKSLEELKATDKKVHEEME